MNERKLRKAGGILSHGRASPRVTHTTKNSGPPVGPYVDGAKRMAVYAAAWRSLSPTQKTEWQDWAEHHNHVSERPVKAPRTNAPRYAKPRRWTGYTMFVSQARASDPNPPPAPNDAARTEPPNMTELLTGGDYEQRMMATLADTSGALTIAMYQISPNWDSPSLAASPLFASLLNQPTRRAQCRMIMSSQPTGSNLQTLNNTAKTLLINRGWTVRNVPQYPILHAKLWLMEPGHVYSGSHNLSNRATTSSIEAGILTTSSSAVNSARDLMQSLWNAAF